MWIKNAKNLGIHNGHLKCDNIWRMLGKQLILKIGKYIGNNNYIIWFFSKRSISQDTQKINKNFLSVEVFKLVNRDTV